VLSDFRNIADDMKIKDEKKTFLTKKKLEMHTYIITIYKVVISGFLDVGP